MRWTLAPSNWDEVVTTVTREEVQELDPRPPMLAFKDAYGRSRDRTPLATIPAVLDIPEVFVLITAGGDYLCDRMGLNHVGRAARITDDY